MKRNTILFLIICTVFIILVGFTTRQNMAKEESKNTDWQEKALLWIPVDVKYAVNKEVGFSLSNCDMVSDLIISPVLEWMSFIGGSGEDQSGIRIAVDNSGNIYVTGWSESTWGSPVNPFIGGDDGEGDIFVAMLNSSGVLQWNTFLGGSDDDVGVGIAVDKSGNIYVAGYSESTWGSPINPFLGLHRNVFVAKLNPSGILQWNSFLCGDVDEPAVGIVTDGIGNIFIIGDSFSTWGSPLNTFAGDEDVFVAKMSSNGVIKWNTFLGGSNDDYGYGIVLDFSGNIYVTGSSESTWGSPLNTFAGFEDAFVAKLNPSGVRQWNTFLGGNNEDSGIGIAVDGSGNIFVTGRSGSTWGNPLNPFSGGYKDGFVAGLNSIGTLQWNMFLGGSNEDFSCGIAVDVIGNIYVTGLSGGSWGSPVNSFKGTTDAFVARLNSSGIPQWNMFLGGSNEDFGYGITVDDSGNIFVIGYSESNWGSPLYPFAGNWDAFVAKICDETNVSKYEITVNRSNLYFGSIGNFSINSQTFLINSNSSLSTIPTWSITDNQDWLSCIPTNGRGPGLVTVSVNPAGLSSGTYTGIITVSDPNATNSPQKINVKLSVYGTNQTFAPFGDFATPIDGSTVSSSVAVTGWVLDDIGMSSVKIYRTEGNKKIFIGDAVFVEGARPDVEQAFPEYPNNYKAGWGYMLLTNFLPNNGNGTFTLHVIATDIEGNQVTLGTKTILVDNSNAFKPFGAIDKPTQGGTASGGNFVNWGWVLTPQPNYIPTDGSTIKVYIDGVKIGHPIYNIYRADIANLFPGYSNSFGAIGYFYLDTTSYENGVHTIQWTATDNAGNSDGIGSRYFTIQNTGTNSRKSMSGVQWTSEYEPIDKRISSIPIDNFGPVIIEKDFNRDIISQEIYPEENGDIHIEIRELERVVIYLGCTQWRGFHVIGSRLKPLPVGSTLDSGRGTFSWQPGPGFIGEYQLVFISREKNGELRKKFIKIIIMPRFEK
jgi:hypothetical protein